MINEVVASAPGKVVLSGEYAVLDGAPAICMAIDRRARAAVGDLPGELSSVTTRGHSSEAGQFLSAGKDIQWQHRQASFQVVDALWAAMDRQRSGALSLDLDSRAFIDTPTARKIGIGASAAITVALCAALTNCADAAVLSPLAHRAHALLQGGMGSGVDVACSLYGGIIEYRMPEASSSALMWPEKLAFRLIWTGVVASTPDKLASLKSAVAKPSRRQLGVAAQNTAMHWRSGDARQIIAGYQDYCQQLQRFSSDHDLGIFDGGHRELGRAARAAGLTYKPCGAGGGDIGIVLGVDPAELDAFTAAQSNKYSLLACPMSTSGVRIEA